MASNLAHPHTRNPSMTPDTKVCSIQIPHLPMTNHDHFSCRGSGLCGQLRQVLCEDGERHIISHDDLG